MDKKACMKKHQNYLYTNFLKLENNFLRKNNNKLKYKLTKYKKLFEVRKIALESAVEKIVDNCKYCIYEYQSCSCKNNCCQKGLCDYFINNAEKHCNKRTFVNNIHHKNE